jgi:hypothetical protein
MGVVGIEIVKASILEEFQYVLLCCYFPHHSPSLELGFWRGEDMIREYL